MSRGETPTTCARPGRPPAATAATTCLGWSCA